MTLQVEAAGAPEGLADAHRRSRSATSPSCAATCSCCAPGSLPNDGKVIEDARSYR